MHFLSFKCFYFFFNSSAGSKTPPVTTDGGTGEAETGSAAGRKRRWGSSTSVTAKKPSISITTDSLKVLTHSTGTRTRCPCRRRKIDVMIYLLFLIKANNLGCRAIFMIVMPKSDQSSGNDKD